MKTMTMLLASLLLPAVITAADPAPKAAPEVKAKAKKEQVYELPKTGKNLQRGSAGWINVEASGTRLIVKFFDAKKKPAIPDVERGFARFQFASKNPERAPLHREGETLVSTATVRPPHNFLVILSLFRSGEAESAESYTFKYP
ncbi:hypothetical protein [Oleiharenicola lentus]|nr:hypothetical protein [Oleiharenicola lentus]